LCAFFRIPSIVIIKINPAIHKIVWLENIFIVLYEFVEFVICMEFRKMNNNSVITMGFSSILGLLLIMDETYINKIIIPEENVRIVMNESQLFMFFL